MILTIAIDRTMRAWLFTVAFDLLPPAFVASPGDPTPFLEMRRWLGAIGLVGGVGRCLNIL